MLALGLAITPWGPGPQAAVLDVEFTGPSSDDGSSTPDPAERPHKVLVKVGETVPDAEMMVTWVEDRAHAVLEERETPLEEADLIRVEIQGAPYDYRVSFTLRRRLAALSPEQQLEPLECSCSTDDLLKAVGEAIGQGADRLAAAARDEREAAAAAHADEARFLAEELRLAEQRAEAAKTRYRPSRLGQIGIGVLGVGGAVTLSGIIVVTRPTRIVEDQQLASRTWSRPGGTLLGLGISAMVVGAAVLVVDVIQCKKGSPRCQGTTARRSIRSLTMGSGRWAR